MDIQHLTISAGVYDHCEAMDRASCYTHFMLHKSYFSIVCPCATGNHAHLALVLTDLPYCCTSGINDVLVEQLHTFHGNFIYTYI